ncbi:zinc finger protein 277-like [Physella acuta]|uniref:zinc finger protein 277-like n=1 Tax=Physella acuta TaxID=109671 RepID=UPI0027DAD3F5|nr:zinc finger protein 277-like [Physella acuta]
MAASVDNSNSTAVEDDLLEQKMTSSPTEVLSLEQKKVLHENQPQDGDLQSANSTANSFQSCSCGPSVLAVSSLDESMTPKETVDNSKPCLENQTKEAALQIQEETTTPFVENSASQHSVANSLSELSSGSTCSGSLSTIPEHGTVSSSTAHTTSGNSDPASSTEVSAGSSDDVFHAGGSMTTQQSSGSLASKADSDSCLAGGNMASDKKLEHQNSEERPVREMLVRRKRSTSTETSSENRPVLETLTFSSKTEEKPAKHDCSKAEGELCMCPCPLCDRSYPAFNKEDILAHLVLMHKFVIADVNYIANLPAYLKYWKKRMEEKPITEFCSKIVTNTGVKDEAPKEEFYLLCDALPEDKDIREHLQRKKLESVLAQQQREREETKFCRQCLFCKQTYCGNRAVLFDHLLRDHTFHMGQPDNLVFTDELFDLIQAKLDNQLCLFCEKSFKDKASLREHMRKKQHRKINPKNKEYDRFYIINYMEMGKNWESLQSEDNRLVKTNDKTSDEEDEWAGWDEESQYKVVCLFCDTSCAVQADLQKHMKENHCFDLQEVNHKLQLNFYQKVKLINYIRRQIYHKTCYGCQVTFADKDELNSHLETNTDHIKNLPDATIWDQPQYFFPTYEDDCLLCHLDDDDDGAAGDAQGVTIYAEDIPVADTILKDQKLCRDLQKS